MCCEHPLTDLGFPMATSVAAVFRAISMLEGSLMRLDPDLNLLSFVPAHGGTLLCEVGGLGPDRHEFALYAAATASQIAALPGQFSRIAGHSQNGTLVPIAGTDIDALILAATPASFGAGDGTVYGCDIRDSSANMSSAWPR
ncbi:hypothetical protein [Brevibacterium aurantiacum]|uniref:hypothetical protein n=1 Tax=Brevibacterium aurantiacum TaxID=273384 RepID=UPI0018677802|nr:hypothetical protein [Brevibacterium aurantiacum]